MGRKQRKSRREPPPRNFYATPIVCGLLLLAVALVFGQTIHHGFINLDDAEYVSENPCVTHGLSTAGFVSALTEPHHYNWCPLTWWSLMLDYQFYGLRPWGYHLTNVLLHAAAAIALFLVLRAMTGRFWPSALVAALFAVHPLRAESVAWVTERKDVLSGLFFMLTLAAYVGYVRRRFSLARYLGVLLVFALGLMAKPMLVTLPLILLLLDYWPLGRFSSEQESEVRGQGLGEEHPKSKIQNQQLPHPSSLIPHPSSFIPHPSSFPLRLVVEKLPLFALMAASCALTLWAQRDLVVSYEHLSWYGRIGNVLVSYAAYLRQFFWPAGLALWYPLQISNLPGWKILGALTLLVAITTGALVGWRRCPYVLVGWLWYVGMLVPVIGVVQVTDQAMADRFTYLPQIGLGIALVWGLGDRRWSWLRYRWPCGVGSALVLAILMGWAWRQVSFWRDSETLWRRTLACTAQNFMAHNMLGGALASQGRLDEAVAQFCRAVTIKPDYAELYYNLGTALASQRRTDEAIVQFRRALSIKSDYAEAHNNLGNALATQGQLDEAMEHYRQALKIKPGYIEAHNDLGSVLAVRGRLDEAIQQYRQALEIKPDYADAYNNLRSALARVMERYRRTLQVKPDDLATANNLAWLLATCPAASLRDGAEAVEIARRADQLSGGKQAAVLDTLAAAYAEAGRFPEAVQTARKALQLATQQKKQPLADSLQTRIRLYESGTPYHESLAP